MANTAALLPTDTVATSVTGQPFPQSLPKSHAEASAIQAPFLGATGTGFQQTAATPAMRLPTQQFPAGSAAGANPSLGTGALQNPGAAVPPGLPGALGVPPNISAAAGMTVPVSASLPGVQGAVAGAPGLGLVAPGDFAAHLNAAASGPGSHVLPTSNPYRDFSRIPVSDMVAGPSEAGGASDAQAANAGASSGKEPPFPVKLHRILSNPEFRDIITWLPHGRSWRVLKPKAFEEKVIPLYFRHAKYASFMRQVNGWGFKRMTQGPDHNSYYHELFLRGLPHLCLKMRRPNRAKQGATDSDLNPDFYRISMVAPLPESEDAESSSALAASTGAAAPVAGAASPAAAAATAAAAGGLPVGLANSTQTASNSPAQMPPNSVMGAGAGTTPPGLSTTELLQQHMKGKLPNPAAGTAGASPAPSPKAGSTTTAGGDNAASTLPAAMGDNNLEAAFRQRIKERSELVRQLKEVMDGAGSSGAAGATAASQQQLQQLQAGLPAQDSSVQAMGGGAAGAAGVPQVMQSFGGIMPGGPTAPGQAFPGMGALSPFGQFQNQFAGQGPYEQLFLDQQHQNLFAAAAGAGGATTMGQNPSALAGAAPGPGSAPNLGNIGLMAMQNQALLAQMQAVQQQQSQLQAAAQGPGATQGAAAPGQAPAAWTSTIAGGLPVKDEGDSRS